jgi:hypothetical protein
MIRAATPDDFPAMLAMAENFISRAWAGVVPFDAESCAALLDALHGNGILLITEDCKGMIGVSVQPWHFNQTVLTAVELFWWCEGRGAFELRGEAEKLAKERGALTMNMGRIHGMRDAALDRIYRAQGYRPSEHIYIKELC